jgi:hypothetical protein
LIIGLQSTPIQGEKVRVPPKPSSSIPSHLISTGLHAAATMFYIQASLDRLACSCIIDELQFNGRNAYAA